MFRIKSGPIRLAVLVMLTSYILSGCMHKDVPAVNNETDSKLAESSFVNLREDSISKESMMGSIKELTSEKYRGRLAGSEGNYLAAQYLADQFRKLGLENPDRLDNYMQSFILPTIVLKSKPVLQIVDKKGRIQADFDYPEDFVIRRLSSVTDNIDIEVPIYYEGEYQKLFQENNRTAGNAVLVPWKFYGLFGSQNRPDDLAKRCGASLTISEFDLSKNDLGYRHLKVTPFLGSWIYDTDYRPFIYVDSDTFAALSEAEKSGGKIRFSCSSVLDYDTKIANVIGVIPGSDPVLKENHIIIGAHFDHVGDNMDGSYNPGALDNASGVAAMLEIARVINENRIRPKQTIVFIAFNAEESGLNGSIYYVQNPLYPLSKSVMINLDMIGAAFERTLSIVIDEGSNTTKKKKLRDTFAEYADELGIAYDMKFEDGSDHTPFLACDVPAVCLVDMDTSYGYHSPADTIDVIDGDRLREAAKLVLYYIDKHAY